MSAHCREDNPAADALSRAFVSSLEQGVNFYEMARAQLDDERSQLSGLDNQPAISRHSTPRLRPYTTV
ncbi:Hypothetical protein FKW44_019587 [Caligus rogercresseyi]|uniref:Uncharacterized protein n=1 Tax=Caligus rogercresseyi TaxID=217165 RepID=A0A7T8GW17_CALRO|nr:Hypothetical protein FKW44_019587 [Caligus rogercresseyi]